MIAAARYSWQGLWAAIRYEAAFRQELMLAVVLVPAALWLGQNAGNDQSRNGSTLCAAAAVPDLGAPFRHQCAVGASAFYVENETE